MTYKNLCSCLLVTGIWLAVPDLVSAQHGLPYEEQGGKGIYSYGSELFRPSELFRESRDKSSERSSETDTQSPSADISPSVHGHTGGVDRPFFGGSPSGGDPMVQDLSRMDGGGFSSPGSAGGSVPGYNGR